MRCYIEVVASPLLFRLAKYVHNSAFDDAHEYIRICI